jgi:hypothetical protein
MAFQVRKARRSRQILQEQESKISEAYNRLLERAKIAVGSKKKKIEEMAEKFVPKMYEILTEKDGWKPNEARRIILQDLYYALDEPVWKYATIVKWLPSEAKDQKKADAGRESARVRQQNRKEKIKAQAKNAPKMALPKLHHDTMRKEDGHSTQIVHNATEVRFVTKSGTKRFIPESDSYEVTINKDGELVSI